MKYITDDGEVVEGATSQAVVEALRDGSRFSSHESLPEFMRGFAARMMEYSNDIISTDSADAFVADLVAVGYLMPQ